MNDHEVHFLINRPPVLPQESASRIIRLVKETLIAKGEVVVEKEKYGIRIVEVVSRTERVKSLK